MSSSPLVGSTTLSLVLLPSEGDQFDFETATAGPVLVLQPGAEGIDARTFSLAQGADVNYGNVPRMEAMAWTWSGVPATMRSFLDFNLSSLPSGSYVRRATLVLTGDAVPNGQPSGHSTLSGPNDFQLEPIVAPWQEDTITWNNQPATDPSRAVLLPASTSNDQSYEADVTQLVRDKLQDPSQNASASPIVAWICG